jgi:hypothetical protein
MVHPDEGRVGALAEEVEALRDGGDPVVRRGQRHLLADDRRELGVEGHHERLHGTALGSSRE